MTMNYENDHSTVRINATAKGNQVEVKVVAQPVPEDEVAREALYRLLKGIEAPVDFLRISFDRKVL